MTDIATISLRVNTGELEKGSQALDKFQQTADKAAKAADGVGQSTGKMAASSEQVKKASDYLEKYNGGIDAFTKSMNKRAIEENKVGDAIAFQNGELEKLLNRINPLNKSFGELDSIAQKLSQAKELKLIDEVSFARYQAILDSTTDKLYKAEEALTEEGREKIKNARTAELLEESQKKLIQSLNAQAATFKASKADIAEYRASQLGISEQAAPIIASLREQEKALEREANQKRIAAIQSRSLKQAIKEMELEERTATAQVNQAAKARADFIQKLKEQVATQNLSRTELLRYKADQLGAGSAADIYIKKLKESANATHRLGLESAGARQEIAVLIGEAARGNFGALRGSGITLANRAGWIEQMMTLKGLGIATVVGGITAAVYGLGKAWYEGSQESVEFNKQLILTGNYAGKTASQLQNMAKSMSGHGITQGDMSRVLAQVVGSGSFRGDQIATVTKAAAAMEEAVGKSVDETIKNFQRLYSDPTKASEELNSQMHYLTSSQYEYISSLERRGFKESAGQAAAEAYSKEEQRRAQATINNLGLIESALLSASKEWKAFWNAARDIGRTKDTSYQLDEINKTITQIYSDREKYGKSDLFESGLQKLLAQKKELEFILSSQNGYLEAQGKAKKADDDRTKSLEYQNQMFAKNMSWQQKRAAALTELWSKVSMAPDVWDQGKRERAVAQINQEFKPPKTASGLKSPKEPAYRDDSATKMIADSKQRLAVLLEQYGVAEKMTEQERRLAEFNQQIYDLGKKKVLTVDQQSLLNRSTEIKNALELEASKSRELENQKKLNALLESAQRFGRQQEAKRTEISALAKGKTPLEAQRDSEMRRIQEEYADNPAAQKQALADIRQTYTEMDALNENWQAGVKVGFAEFAREATDTYGQVSRITQGAFQGMSASITDFLVEGKNSFGDFLKTFLKGIAQMMVQLAMLRTMKMAFAGTGVGSFLGFANGGYVPAFDTGGYTGDGGKFEPKGVVHGGEFVFTKAATQALGVGNLYAMMHGAQGYADGGIVGKAPIASIPALRPGYGSGGTGITVSMGDVVISGGNQQQPSGQAPSGDAIMKQLKPAIVATVSEQANKPGTPLWNAINGKR